MGRSYISLCIDYGSNIVYLITREDYFDAGLPFYTINRHIEQLNMQPFLDRQHIIYVNGKFDDNSAIGRLMHDFRCENPSDMYYKELAERTHYLKENEGGRDNMCKAMEELLNDEKIQTALRMLSKTSIHMKKSQKFLT